MYVYIDLNVTAKSAVPVYLVVKNTYALVLVGISVYFFSLHTFSDKRLHTELVYKRDSRMKIEHANERSH